jgi:hypothetical protein
MLLTERGRPLAVGKSICGGEMESTIQKLESAGFLRPASRRGALPVWGPRWVRGVPVSQMVREERDDRWRQFAWHISTPAHW